MASTWGSAYLLAIRKCNIQPSYLQCFLDCSADFIQQIGVLWSKVNRLRKCIERVFLVIKRALWSVFSVCSLILLGSNRSSIHKCWIKYNLVSRFLKQTCWQIAFNPLSGNLAKTGHFNMTNIVKPNNMSMCQKRILCFCSADLCCTALFSVSFFRCLEKH